MADNNDAQEYMRSAATHSSGPLSWQHSCLDRVQRLKEARTEAAHEIEELKASKQEAFKKFEQEVHDT